MPAKAAFALQEGNVTPFPAGPREAERLKALYDLQILDTPPETHFDAVCRAAQRLFDVPIVLVSLMEGDRQWFKARCGLDVDSTSREVAFCTYAILSDEIMVVEDATRDPRFEANPFVTGAPFIRFYAGCPLIVEPGLRVGTLCIIDREPRTLSAADAATLRDLASVVIAHLKLHKARVDSEDESAVRRANEALIAQQARELAARAGELEAQQEILDVTLAHMDQGLMMVDSSGVVQVCNKRAIELLNLPPALMAGKPTFEAVRQHQLQGNEFVKSDATFVNWVRSSGIEDREHCYERERPNGQVLEIRTVPLPSTGGVVRTYTDVTLRKEAERRLEHQAHHDALTGLPNRTAFAGRLQQRLAEVRRQGGAFALLCLDLDRFKLVNDRHGHPVGDALLQQVAARMSALVRSEDTLARVGGDEFVVLQVGDVQPEAVQSLARRLIAAVEEPFAVEGRTLSIGLSIGIAVAPTHGDDAATLLKSADLALYAAKEAGRNTFRLFDTALANETAASPTAGA